MQTALENASKLSDAALSDLCSARKDLRFADCVLVLWGIERSSVCIPRRHTPIQINMSIASLVHSGGV
jgi:hypothetical protein